MLCKKRFIFSGEVQSNCRCWRINYVNVRLTKLSSCRCNAWFHIYRIILKIPFNQLN